MNTRRAHIVASQRAMTLLEVLICSAILGLMLLALGSMVSASWGTYGSGTTHAELQEIARRAMDRIVEDLRQSGIVDNSPNDDFPYIFADGQATGYFAPYAHQQANHEAEAGSIAYGPSREIVFRLTHDNDDDGYPTDAANGQIEWGDDEYQYLLVTNDQGVNELRRRVNTGEPSIIARYVERLTFDNSTTDPDLPVNQVRVTLHMRKTTPDHVIRYSLSSTVMMRNSEGYQ